MNLPTSKFGKYTIYKEQEKSTVRHFLKFLQHMTIKNHSQNTLKMNISREKFQTVNPKRVGQINSTPLQKGPIIYWMSRDQRLEDNWSLLYAAELAKQQQQPLIVVFCLIPHFLEATLRQYDFMLQGLEELAEQANKIQLPFQLLLGNPEEEIPKFAQKIQAGAVVSDFDPLKIKQQWLNNVAHSLHCAHFEVDAHNIVPCWTASPKKEFGAYTLRPKIYKLLPEFFTEFPQIHLPTQTWTTSKINPIDWLKVRHSLKINPDIKPVNWLKPGAKAAHQVMKKFLSTKLNHYDQARNNPNLEGQSELSPYLHFGQLSAQRVALEVAKLKLPATPSATAEEQKKSPFQHLSIDQQAYLEELIIRRELSDNFCYYEINYDNFRGFPNWAQLSLNQHRQDQREYIYSQEQFEQASTHDPLWNAAQTQLLETGKMHGYLRMYWCKKILEWTASPEEAQKIAIYLNDKYELDGRDPNGYTGIAWSIGGIHDRAWFNRPVFGKIRYMNAKGCQSKFSTETYIQSYSNHPGLF